jgi:hypothetical protein
MTNLIEVLEKPSPVIIGIFKLDEMPMEVYNTEYSRREASKLRHI